MSNQSQYWHYVQATLHKPNSDGQKQFITRIKATTRERALMKMLQLVETENLINTLSIIRDVVPCSEYKRKPPSFQYVDPKADYKPVYDGLTLKEYQHSKTGTILSIEDYQEL